MQKYKIFTAKEIIVLFFLLASLQSCKAIRQPDYRYLYEQSESEKRQMLEDKIFEKTPTLPKKKGASNEK